MPKPNETIPFFSYGFRPFFLGAATYAVVAMALWLAWLAIHAANASLDWISISGPPHIWHAHEMVFGFAMAAVAGFLLTAVPNWTGALPLNGRPLVILFAIWLAGRVAMIASAFVPASLVAPVDLIFIPALGLHVTRQLLIKPTARNLIFLAILVALFAANTAYHLAAASVLAIETTTPIRAGLLTIVIVVVIIGGRIVPSFTHNHLHRTAPSAPMPYRSASLDLVSLLSTVAFALLTLYPVPGPLLAAAAALAAVSNAVRLVLWRGFATLDSPIVWFLHLGYLWIVIGLGLWALSASTDIVSEISALHALGTGGIGTMVLAVMSRASLGHTGRPLVAPGPLVIAYVFVSLSAALRAFGPPLVPSFYSALMISAGLLWMAAFAIFSVIYFPILTRPRISSGNPTA